MKFTQCAALETQRIYGSPARVVLPRFASRLEQKGLLRVYPQAWLRPGFSTPRPRKVC